MPRLNPIQPEQATGKAKELLDVVQAKLKATPNMFRTMANSPAVLEAYLNFSGALAAGVLSPKLREQIALAVSEQNGCQYCVSAHTYLGKAAGIDAAELEAARDAHASSAKSTAALAFARAIVEKKGLTAEADVDAVRAAGCSDAEIAEIIAHAALNVLTNYFNNTAGVEVDFPKIELRKVA